jgi:hypothetical protein
MSAPEKQLRGLFVALFLLVQITVPLFGLYASHRLDRPVRFGWQMSSRIPVVEDGE